VFNLRISNEAFQQDEQIGVKITTSSIQDDSQSSEIITKTNRLPSNYAYAFLIAGCDPKYTFHLNYIYNIIVSTRILRISGSTNDVIVMIRMGSWVSDVVLPKEHQSMLETAGIIVKYLPKSLSDNFYTAQMDKFWILELVQYRRVLYMDADVMPFCNLDYFFELSDGPNATLRENIILAGNNEPAHGGLFMLKPSHEDFKEITEIIHTHYENGGVFDEEIGWGYNITSTDKWETLFGEHQGTYWNFYAAFADQGLLYYWTKYRKKNVSILGSKSAKSWYNSSVLGLGGDIISEKINEDLHFRRFDLYLEKGQSFFETNEVVTLDFAPYSDFRDLKHAEPWKQAVPSIERLTDVKNLNELWFYVLQAEIKRISLPLQIHDIKMEAPILNTKPTKRMAKNAAIEFQQSAHISEWDKHGLDAQQCLYDPRSASTESPIYAYVYLMAGCDPRKPGYLGYISNIIVSTRILRCDGSKNDIIVLVRMANTVSREKLPDSQEEMLKKAGVIVKYLPKGKADNFFTAQMDKFRILELVQYRRVVYMDADVMPFCNLDYFFELSDGPNATLRENVIIPYRNEPAHGGLFMLKPSHEDFKEITEIIHTHYENGGVFDEEIGWGHKIIAPDEWRSVLITKEDRKWDFYGAFADQGLLYYWTKYRKKNVSILFRGQVESWYNSSVSGAGGVISKEVNKGLHLRRFSNTRKTRSPFLGWEFGLFNVMPYSDFKHFSGRLKPWRIDPPNKIPNPSTARTSEELWYHILFFEEKRLNLELDTKNLKKYGRPSLGLFPTYHMAGLAAEAHKDDR